MMKDKDFYKDIDKLAQSSWKKIYHTLIETNTKIYSISFGVDLSDHMIKKYNLNNDISIRVNANGGIAQTEYYYKELKIDPICYYIRPSDYHHVSTLRTIQECISQNTERPDIKYLERGEERLKKIEKIIDKY